MAKNRSDETAEQAAAVDPNLALEVEKLRLQNELADKQLEIERLRKPQPSPDEVATKRLAEQQAKVDQALVDLADGPYKFRVHLPGNHPVAVPHDKPHLTVGASQRGEAATTEIVRKYNTYMGIRMVGPPDSGTLKRYQIQEMATGKSQEVESTEAAAQVDFTPAGASAGHGIEELVAQGADA